MKRIASLLAVLLALPFPSCNKVETPAPEAELKFDINVVYGNDADTRVVKTDWEDGDKILVYFKKDGVSSALKEFQYLTITYVASEGLWSAPSYTNLTAGDLGSSGTMYGVYFPFGNVTSVIEPIQHSETYRLFFSTGNENPALDNYPAFSWYMIDTGSPYTVSHNTVIGTLSMVLPENFVYFYIDAADGKYNQNEKYRLCVEGVKPSTVIRWSGGSFTTLTLNEGMPMWGYKYGDGIAFAGIIDNTWAAPADHKFIFFSDGDPAVTKTITGISLASHESVKLSAPTAANEWTNYMEAPDVEEIGGIKWSKWFLGSTGADDVTSKATFRWAEIVPDRGDNSTNDFPSLPRHNLSGDYAIFDPARAILGAEWRMANRSDFASLVANATLTTSNSWFTFTEGDHAIRFATHNVLYGSGGSNYIWTGEIANNTFCYVREYHVGQGVFPEASSGTADAVRRTFGSNFVRPIYIGSNDVDGDVNLGGYEPVEW